MTYNIACFHMDHCSSESPIHISYLCRVNELYKDLDKFVQSNFEVDKLCESVEVLKDVADLLEPQGEVTVGSLLRNRTEFTDFLEREYGISPQLANELVNADINYNKVSGAIFHKLYNNM